MDLITHKTETGHGIDLSQLFTSHSQVFGGVMLIWGSQEAGFQEQEDITLCEETAGVCFRDPE